MLSEMWRDMIDFEGCYQGSYLGHIRSLDRVVAYRRSSRRLKGRILRLRPNNEGYLMVNLCKNGIQTTCLVHRLIAAAWIGSCPNNCEVCHGRGGRTDNSVSNLCYDTHQNNSLDKRRDNTHGGRPVRRSDGIEFINMSIAAEESGCHVGNICKVCDGKRKTTGGYGWEYTDV